MSTAISTTSPLTKSITDSGVSAETADYLVRTFGPYFAQASEIIEASRQIEVSDATQLSEMKAAREARLKLKAIRVEADKTRKSVKEESLRLSKAIDNVAKTVPMLTEPEEARLEECERFAELAEAKRQATLTTERARLLAAEGDDPTVYRDLGAMPQQKFADLLAQARDARARREEAARKAEEERQAAERKRREDEERLRAENDRLRTEREEADRQRREAEQKAQAERREREEAERRQRAEADAKLRVEREAAEKERRRLQAESDAKLKAEREAREKLEREAREREEAERKRKAAEELAAKKAAAAPDADKLRTLAATVAALPIPAMKTAEGNAAREQIAQWLDDLARRISDRADSLT